MAGTRTRGQDDQAIIDLAFRMALARVGSPRMEGTGSRQLPRIERSLLDPLRFYGARTQLHRSSTARPLPPFRRSTEIPCEKIGTRKAQHLARPAQSRPLVAWPPCRAPLPHDALKTVIGGADKDSRPRRLPLPGLAPPLGIVDPADRQSLRPGSITTIHSLTEHVEKPAGSCNSKLMDRRPVFRTLQGWTA